MPVRTLIFLANVSFEFGLIDLNEFNERINVARWIGQESPAPDPREPFINERTELDQEPDKDDPEVRPLVQVASNLSEQDRILFLAFKKWYFTISDPDPDPSTPHGHLNSPNNKWPKLNPYTGRVFKAKHQEDRTQRLTKKEMRELWRTEAFRDFCRSHILWFAEQFPSHRFDVKDRLRFPVW